ncbi:15270_t:CDS:2 [Racocetra fulgida]|uniref:15270_t:CDS:1 n=1 Tax=Racocetra fulgida TaxID=60492 RepID=A0A9N9FAA3_9GLOM|nr:15270_t:CDS:2 [Racocetra fulgida]
MSFPFDYYPLLEDDTSLLFRYEDELIETNNFEVNEEKKDTDYEASDDEELQLKVGMIFETWEIAKSYLKDYAKHEGFCFRKRRCVSDPADNSIIRRRTFECSYAHVHQNEKVILAKNKRNRDSGMIGCSWHVNMSFSKTTLGVRVNSIEGEYCHSMNSLITIIALKFRHLTNEMLEKIEFWTIHGRLDISMQYDLLTASFPDKKINKKDLSNAIQHYKKKAKLQKNDACQTLTNLYLKKENDPLWAVKPKFDLDERSEYRNEIPTSGIPNIMEEYFPDLNKLLRDYLTPQIFQKQCDQMSQSLCYDAFLVDNWSSLLEVRIHLLISISVIKSTTDDSCESETASVDQQIHRLTPTYQIVENKLDQLPSQPLQFKCLANIRKTAFDEFVNYLERFIKTMKGNLDKQQENDSNVKNLVVKDPIRV